MSGNAQKTPFASTINRFAERKVQDALQTLGKSLPCHVVAVSGSIVTVRFDINSKFTLPDVTCPEFGPEYIRYPTQIGDKGVVMAADCYIGGVSGLGGGVAGLGLRANLSTLIFYPIANVDWSTSENPNAVIIYGPDGVAIRPTNSASGVYPRASGAILAWGQESMDGSIATTGNLSAGTGATGVFQSADGQSIMVIDGIVVSIS